MPHPRRPARAVRAHWPRPFRHHCQCPCLLASKPGRCGSARGVSRLSMEVVIPSRRHRAAQLELRRLQGGTRYRQPHHAQGKVRVAEPVRALIRAHGPQRLARPVGAPTRRPGISLRMAATARAHRAHRSAPHSAQRGARRGAGHGTGQGKQESKQEGNQERNQEGAAASSAACATRTGAQRHAGATLGFARTAKI